MTNPRQMDTTDLRKINVQRRRPDPWLVENEPEDPRQLFPHSPSRGTAVLAPPDIQLSDLSPREMPDLNP